MARQKQSKGNIAFYARPDRIMEKAKAEIPNETRLNFLSKLGDEHPYNFAKARAAYLTVPIITGAIDKFVDFATASGFYVKCEDERAEQILTDFMNDMEFNTLLRRIIRDVLLYGNSFVEIVREKQQIAELKALNPEHIYVRRDKFGTILGYTQWFEGLGLRLANAIQFEPDEIAHFTWNKIGDSAYGFGIVFPHLDVISQKLSLEKDMKTIFERKANPYFLFKIGSDTFPAQQADIDNLKADLESLKANQDFVGNHTWDIRVIEPSALGEKFTAPFEHYENQLIYGLQIPQVLMGKGNIAEGLAKVQLDAFERKIKSLQEEIEKTIEQNILRPVLAANGFPNERVEFEWGQPSQDDVKDELLRITELLKIPSISPALKTALEMRLVELMKLDVKEEELEGRDAGLEQQPQPRVPAIPAEEKLKEAHITQEQIDALPLKEYAGVTDKLEEAFNKLGFTYDEYVDSALKYINSKGYYNHLKTIERVDHKELQKIFDEGFRNGWSVQDMAKAIRERADLKELDRFDVQTRSLNIARTETIQISTITTLERYGESDVVEGVEWNTAIDERTCDICAGLDGQTAPKDDLPEAWNGGPGFIHMNCRCRLLPVLKEEYR